MSLLGRLRCWLTGKHDWQWEDAKGVYVKPGGQVKWCPRCTKIRDVWLPEENQ